MNKEQRFCQSCGMPLTDDVLGTNAEGFKGMMLRGSMEVLTDAASKEIIWRDGDTAIHPELTDKDRQKCRKAMNKL